MPLLGAALRRQGIRRGNVRKEPVMGHYQPNLKAWPAPFARPKWKVEPPTRGLLEYYARRCYCQ